MYHSIICFHSIYFFTPLFNAFSQRRSPDPSPLWPVVICQKGCMKIAMHCQNGVKATLLSPKPFFQ